MHVFDFFASCAGSGHVRAIEWTAGVEKPGPVLWDFTRNDTCLITQGKTNQRKTKQASFTADKSSKRMNDSAASGVIDEAIEEEM
eukprot:scaffold7715_cov91-Skeletonema_dohrnii-CCMP3373.AAC.5